MACDSLLSSLRVKLGDENGRRYKNESVLWEAINDGICEVWSTYPEQFAQNGFFSVKPGDCQCLPDCCRILEVRGVFDGDTLVNTIELQKQEASEDRLNKPSCLTASAGGKVTAYRSELVPECITLSRPIDACELDGKQLRIKGVFACRPDPAAAGDDCDWADCKAKSTALNWAAGTILMNSDRVIDRQKGRDFLQLFAGGVRVRKEANDRLELPDE